jgi:two-component system sensor histidine kinase TctE
VILSDQYDHVYYSIIDDEGNILGGDRDLQLIQPQSRSESSTYFSFAKIHGELIRVATTSANIKMDKDVEHVRIQVAETLNKRNRLASQILIGIIVPQLVLVLATAGLLWFGIGRGLLPLWELNTALTRRSPRDLSPVRLPDIPDEVKALVDSVNLLMQQLQNVLESQNRFVADAAHQLRTPLAGMQAQLELVNEETDPQEVQAGLARIASSLERLSHLVNQLLMLARNQPEVTRSINMSYIDLNQLAQDATTDMVPTALMKDIDLGFEGLPDGVMIEAEPQRLKELMYNLIDNAIRYTQHGGKVTVSTGLNDRHARLSVEDNGPGIPAEEQAKVFERFHRVIGTGQDGSGLGLAIVWEIAQLHNASVTASQPASGKGTIMSVFFDAAPSAIDPVQG